MPGDMKGRDSDLERFVLDGSTSRLRLSGPCARRRISRNTAIVTAAPTAAGEEAQLAPAEQVVGGGRAPSAMTTTHARARPPTR